MDISIKEISEDIVAKLDAIAVREKRSRNQQIILILEQATKVVPKPQAHSGDRKLG